MIDVNKIIDEAIIGLAGDSPTDGIDQIYELAVLYKSAGMPASAFIDICGYIENEAIGLSEEKFVNEKIYIALKKVREMKRGRILRAH